MQNIQELKNFPIGLWEQIRIWYETYYANISPEQIWSDSHHATSIDNVRWKEMGLEKLPITPVGVEIYYNIPSTRIRPHIDRGRRSALQIPIQADYENSYTFAAKTDDLSMIKHISAKHIPRPTIPNIIHSPPSWFWEWDPEKYDTHPMDIPILENVSVPHGGYNNSRTMRILISISYLVDFESVKKTFSEWI